GIAVRSTRGVDAEWRGGGWPHRYRSYLSASRGSAVGTATPDRSASSFTPRPVLHFFFLPSYRGQRRGPFGFLPPQACCPWRHRPDRAASALYYLPGTCRPDGSGRPWPSCAAPRLPSRPPLWAGGCSADTTVRARGQRSRGPCRSRTV